LTLGGTLAGIAALLALKFQPAASSLAAGTSAAPVTTGTPPASTAPASTGASGTSAKASKPAGTSPGGTSKSTTARMFTGTVDNTSYGPMQVAISVAGGKITKINVVQQTNTGSESQQIDSGALPKLTSEALAAQSAKIDAVSGASYTSAGYIQSLQSAIDQAGL
jgi:uncharacterized protein with FMN-binding domain